MPVLADIPTAAAYCCIGSGRTDPESDGLVSESRAFRVQLPPSPPCTCRRAVMAASCLQAHVCRQMGQARPGNRHHPALGARPTGIVWVQRTPERRGSVRCSGGPRSKTSLGFLQLPGRQCGVTMPWAQRRRSANYTRRSSLVGGYGCRNQKQVRGSQPK